MALNSTPVSAILSTVMAKHTILEEIENGYSVQSGVFGAINEKITTSLNEYGQYEAHFDASKFTEEELDSLAAVSAMSNHNLNEGVLGKKLFGGIKDIKHDDLLGYYTDLYAGYVTEGDYRANASSGGLGSWLLVQLLERKLIDGVIHVVPVDPSEENGLLFKYSISKTPEAIVAGAKSRYYPADLSEVLRTVKKTGGKYAITGIPSFITELRLLSEYDEDFKKSIAFTIGLICGHQKSTKYAEAIAWQHGIKPGNLKSINFRKKLEGMPAHHYIAEFTGTINGKETTLVKDADEVFVSNWSHSFFKSKLSDFTDDVFNETSDVSLGDAWLPQYENDIKGTNVVIVRNQKIARILREGLKNGQLKLDVLTPDVARKSQNGLVRHNRQELPYRLHKYDAKNVIWRPRKRLKASSSLPFLRKRVQDAREKIFTQSHIHYQEAVKLDDWNYFYRKMKPLKDYHDAIYAIMHIRRHMKSGPVYIVKKIQKRLKP